MDLYNELEFHINFTTSNINHILQWKLLSETFVDPLTSYSVLTISYFLVSTRGSSYLRTLECFFFFFFSGYLSRPLLLKLLAYAILTVVTMPLCRSLVLLVEFLLDLFWVRRDLWCTLEHA